MVVVCKVLLDLLGIFYMLCPTRRMVILQWVQLMMDALISPSSKSYYACVGESTRAYQSPSKDMNAINNHLNSSRKIRGSLNFYDVDGGLVSDSLVANSIYLQTGTCTSSSGAPLKSEQPDTQILKLVLSLFVLLDKALIFYSINHVNSSRYTGILHIYLVALYFVVLKWEFKLFFTILSSQ